MRGRIALIILVVSALVIVGVVVDAYAYHGKGKGCKMSMEDKFYKKAGFIMMNETELGLSPDQVKKIKDLKMDTKKSLIKTDAEIDLLALEIKGEMYEDTINTDATDKLIDKKYDLKKEKTKMLVGACASIKTILTKQQRDKMKELMKKEKKEKYMSGGMMMGQMR